MSVLIKGMKMPKDYKQRSATLDRQTDDGILRLFVYDFDSKAMKYSCRVYPIAEIPTPHGRLIDADAIMDLLEKSVPEKNIGHQLELPPKLLNDGTIHRPCINGLKCSVCGVETAISEGYHLRFKYCPYCGSFNGFNKTSNDSGPVKR